MSRFPLHTIDTAPSDSRAARETIALSVSFANDSTYPINLTGCALDPKFQPQGWTSPASSRRSA